MTGADLIKMILDSDNVNSEFEIFNTETEEIYEISDIQYDEETEIAYLITAE